MINLQNKNEGWSDTYEILMSFFSEKKKIMIIIMYVRNLIFNAEFLSMALRESDAASFHFKAEKS